MSMKATAKSGKRWKAIATYRTNNCQIEKVHFVEEIEELQHVLEQGPDWNALVDCRITYDHQCRPPDWTVEQGATA